MTESTNDTRTLEEVVDGLTVAASMDAGYPLRQAVKECNYGAGDRPMNTYVGAVIPYEEHGLSRLYRGGNYLGRIHAEVSAILYAQSRGADTKGCTLYSTWASCRDCARAIVDAGIVRVVTLDKTLRLTPDRWRESVRDGLAYLLANGVKVERYTGTLGMELKFDGKVIDV